jgi:hypothetical protein
MRRPIIRALAAAACLTVLPSVCLGGQPQAGTGREPGFMVWRFAQSLEDAAGVCKDYWGLSQDKKRQVLDLYREYQGRFADALKSIWSDQVGLEFALIDNPKERDKAMAMADQLSASRARLLRDRVEFRSRMAELTGTYIPLATDFVECLGVLRHGDGERYPDEGSLPGDTGEPSQQGQGGLGGSPGKGGPAGPDAPGNDEGVEKF